MIRNAASKIVFSAAAFLAGLASIAQAGHTVEPESKAVAAPVRTWLPDQPPGLITLGGLFSEGATGGFVDTTTGIWATEKRDSFLFLNSRYHIEDNDQFISSTGLGFRKLLPGGKVIIGGNVFWDSIQSERDNDFDQLGLGVEVLSHSVDFRFNYYLPEDDQYEVDRRTTRDRHTVARFPTFSQVETRTRHYKRYEAALEGFNTEVGFLLPGVDRYMEVRAFAGYYHYENPFGGDFEGFKARLEARVLKGVIADLEYWDDTALMGGHWTAGVRVSVPFSIHNLFAGRNPFEGIGESFKPGVRSLPERMNEMVMRSHRIQTTTSGDRSAGDFRTVDTFGAQGQPISLPPGFPVE